MSNFNKEELEKVYNSYMDKYTETFFKEKMKEFPDYWVGYEELSYDDIRLVFKEQLVDEAQRTKRSMEQVFKSFMNGNMFVDPDTRYGRNAAIAMRNYAPDLFLDVSEYIGADLRDAKVRVIDGDKQVFEFFGPKGLVRITCTRGLSPKELLALGSRDAYIVEYL